jgi:hypothetical protein
MKSVFWILVRKDLYLQRGLMMAMVAAGVLALVLALLGGMAFAVGGILFLTANVAGAIFIAMFTIFNERKELTRAFSLSLPVSGAQYEKAKIVAGYVAFLIPWALLTALALLLFRPAGPHHGMLVYTLVLQGFVMAMFSVMQAALFFVTSEIMSGLLILAINILFSLFMVSLNVPGISGGLDGPEYRWTPFAAWMLASELLAVVLSIVFSLSAIARRRDFL